METRLQVQFPFSTERHRIFVLLLASLISACTVVKPGERTAEWVHPEDLFIVDCLLPSQVRQLGRQLTYLAPRRPTRTTAAMCALRGGEYTAYSRSDFTSALLVWRPMAELGDPQAQTYVGEIYEKGLGTTASYKQAAYWYRKASDQNYSRAKINLGFLYESGLGVEKNLVEALNLYREASGFNPQHLEFISSVDYQNKESLKHHNQILQRDTRQLEQDLTTAYQRLQEQAAVIQSSQQSVRELENRLVKQKATDNRTENEARDTPQSGSRSDSASVSTLEAERLVKSDAEKTQAANTEDTDTDTGTGTGTNSTTTEPPEETREATVAQLRLPETLQTRLDERHATLAKQESEMKMLRTRLLAIETQLGSINSSGSDQPESKIALAIDIIDPPLQIENSSPTIVTSTTGAVDLVGKVNPAELVYSLRINGKNHDFDRHGLFHYVSPRKADSHLDLSAVDHTGNVTRVSLLVRTARNDNNEGEPLQRKKHHIQARATGLAQSVDTGDYHALLITNDSYQYHPDLTMASKHGNKLGTLLTEKFGFKTTQVSDGSGVDILGAFDALRSTLTRDDNLLVFFAGHSRLDDSGNCFWLPSDAADNSDRTWLGTRAIVRLIDTLLAKHVLILADACFDETITRTSIARPLPEQSAAQRMRWLKAISRSKARTVLASGTALTDTADKIDESALYFTDAVVAALWQSEGVTEAFQLFLDVQRTVSATPGKHQISRLPYYSPIRHAGHEAGEFIFVPTR